MNNSHNVESPWKNPVGHTMPVHWWGLSMSAWELNWNLWASGSELLSILPFGLSKAGGCSRVTWVAFSKYFRSFSFIVVEGFKTSLHFVLSLSLLDQASDVSSSTITLKICRCFMDFSGIHLFGNHKHTHTHTSYQDKSLSFVSCKCALGQCLWFSEFVFNWWYMGCMPLTTSEGLLSVWDFSLNSSGIITNGSSFTSWASTNHVLQKLSWACSLPRSLF